MKLFGLNISKANLSQTSEKLGDNVTVSTVTPSNTSPISQTPTVRPRVLNYSQTFARGKGHFVSGEYDLSEIGKIEDVDCFVRQSFKKKIGLMFKEGVGYAGANKDTIRYIKTRMAQIARATNIPQMELMKRVGSSLIRVSNAFLVKVRDSKASGGKERIDQNGKLLKPIAGYFPVAPETMRVDIDQDTGRLRRWKQILPDGRFKFFPIEDVVHFHIDRREGFLFGIPTLIPVIDDIRALRQIEENVELLLYQNLFPLFHYKVGTETNPAGLTEDGEKEIEIVEQQIKYMPSEGALVTPERHEIKAIGAEGRALRAEGYLDHFKKRVFAGLGVSSVDMGEGDSTNKATAFTLSRQLIDTVKDIQDVFESQWNYEIISELLLESTFGPEVLEEENIVRISFQEIDIQNKMEQEEHASKMFEANGLTFDEFRAELKKEPILIPEDPEDQDLSKYPEWSNTYWKLFQEPLNLIRAVDEPYGLAAQAASASRSMALTTKAIAVAQQAKEKDEERVAEQNRKTKLALSQKKNTKDNFIASSYRDLESDTINRIKLNIQSRNRVDSEYLLSMSRIWSQYITEKLYSLLVANLIRGFNDQTGNKSSQAELLISFGRKTIEDRISLRIHKLVEFTMKLIKHQVDSIDGNVKLANIQSEILKEVHNSFDVTRFRTKFIWDVENRKAYNFGRILGLRFLRYQFIKMKSQDNACERCLTDSGRLQHVDIVDIDEILPHHANCNCQFEVIKTENNVNDETLKDAEKLERCVLQVKRDLRKNNPGLSDKEIKSRAFAICNSRLKKG